MTGDGAHILPGARWESGSFSVIVPAHNEAAVIARTLQPLAAAAERGDVEIVVVCNACEDDTAAVAEHAAPVTLVQTDTASKPHALNLGDAQAHHWPRIYLDADIEVCERTLLATVSALRQPGVLAARPAARYDVSGATGAVRSYYRARSRLPSFRRALWGAGVYGLSEYGHQRLGRFPELTGDDLWVDRLFAADEKAVVDIDPVVVRVPLTLPALLAITRRNTSGAREQSPGGGRDSTTERTVHELFASVRAPLDVTDFLVFAAVATAARLGARSGRRWERDDTSRR
ncbi:glycosyltransferase [Microbacterium allomyrinae]|uniref:4,4'-diaponeurosporenoate glycosyltransferase n=1 Tax=Microbacterium allomyrinae TaxID=2830666 RepID=A0A9X1S3C2_9MICO|nr:glycosyltransferase [Microbacterium allomyrinae]MCC2033029.1 glycosyltransferase [Microbacterium allomyrinae]